MPSQRRESHHDVRALSPLPAALSGGTRTEDPDEAAMAGSRVLSEHRLVPSVRFGFQARIASTAVGRLSVLGLAYAAPVGVLATSPLPYYTLQYALAGAFEVAVGGRRVVVRKGQGLIVPPSPEVAVTFAAGAAQIAVKVPESTMIRALDRFGLPPLPCPILSAPQRGPAWTSTLLLALDALSRKDDARSLDHLGDELERMLMDTVVLARHADDGRPAPRKSADSRGRRAAREVAARMRHHPVEHSDVVLLAREAGISLRTLEEAFADVFGCTPTAYSRQLRLELVHRRLARATRAETTVTQVAMEFGFTHLGRFAGAYRESYGVNPSETLAHSRSAASGAVLG